MFDWIKNLFCFKEKTKEPLPTLSKEIKDLVHAHLFSNTIIRSVDIPFAPSAQEDPRTIQSVKNTRKAFKEQQQQMAMRAMKSHAVECDDPFTCTAEPCFKRKPDKVVKSETVSADRYNDQRKKNMNRLKKLKKKKEPSEAYLRWQEDNR